MDDGYIGITKQLSDKLALLPEQPGCYIMKDKAGSVLYVGKAKVLKNRVRSYFQRSSQLTRHKRRMVFEVCDIDTIVVNSEREAFILESNLIKKHMPPYNVLLKDDKSYPYITVTTSERYPRVLIRHKLRRKKNDEDRYFGPYTDGMAVKEMVKLIRKVFRIPCGYREPDKAGKGCMYWHIGQCIGVCAGKATYEEYMNAVSDTIAFLEGKRKDLLVALRRRMNEASEELDFEKAAAFRDQINAIERLSGPQTIIDDDLSDRDIISLAADSRFACINLIQIRQGNMTGQNSFELSNVDEEAPEAAIGEFMAAYYNEQSFIPPEIIVSHTPCENISDMLCQIKGSKVSVIKPARGRKRELLSFAEKNSARKLFEMSGKYLREESFNTQSLAELARAIGMDFLPARMECYDISHIQGTNTVASLVTFTDGVPDKDKYRHFKLRTTEGKPDDFLSMKEVITRRLAGSLRSTLAFKDLPDLFIIDGGKGQLSSVLEVFGECGVEGARVISLAKREEIIFLADMTPVVLPKRSKGLMLLQRIRDEAHRFAITHHRTLRGKALSRSTLSEIEGIGPARRNALIKSFGSVAAVADAAPEDLARVPGISKVFAQRIYDYFHGDLSK